MADVSKDPGGPPAGRPLLRPFSGHGGVAQGALRPLGARRIAVSPHARSETPTDSGTPTPTVVPASSAAEASESGRATAAIDGSDAAAAIAAAVVTSDVVSDALDTSEPPHAVDSDATPARSLDLLLDGSESRAATVETAASSALDVQSLRARHESVDPDDRDWNEDSVAYGSGNAATPLDVLAIDDASAAPISRVQPHIEEHAALDIQDEAPPVAAFTEATSQPGVSAVDEKDYAVVSSIAEAPIAEAAVDDPVALDARDVLPADAVPNPSPLPTYDAPAAISGASLLAADVDPDALEGTSAVTAPESRYVAPEMEELVAESGSWPAAAELETLPSTSALAPSDGSDCLPFDLAMGSLQPADSEEPVDARSLVDAVAPQAMVEGPAAARDALPHEDLRQHEISDQATLPSIETIEVLEVVEAIEAKESIGDVTLAARAESVPAPVVRDVEEGAGEWPSLDGVVGLVAVQPADVASRAASSDAAAEGEDAATVIGDRDRSRSRDAAADIVLPADEGAADEASLHDDAGLAPWQVDDDAGSGDEEAQDRTAMGEAVSRPEAEFAALATPAAGTALLDAELAGFHLRPGEAITPPPPIPGIESLGASEEEVVGDSVPESVLAVVAAGEGSSAPESRGDLAADGTALAVALGGEITAWSEGSGGPRGTSAGSPGLAQGDADLQDFVARSEAQAHVLATLDMVARRVRGGEIVPTLTAGCSPEAVLASVLASLLSPRT